MKQNPPARPAVPVGRDHQAFPTFTSDQITRIRPFGHVEQLADQTRVLNAASELPIFFVVLSGCIEIFDYDRDRSRALRRFGAVPNSACVAACVMTDENGFICTGQDVVNEGQWPLDRSPEPFETSLPSVFAIGDVRGGSVKRVASAVGEGSICVRFVHRTLSAKS